MSQLFNQLNTIPAAVINTANEWRNIGCTSFCSKNSLTCREYQGAIRTDTIVGKPFDGLDAILDHGHLHHNIGMNGGQCFSFSNH